MNITEDLTPNQKQVKLILLSNTLKTKFIGLDSIIDDILELVKPWYIYPEFQVKPTIINLWGMTGVGKTAIVNEIAQNLTDEEYFYHFDLGNKEDGCKSIKDFFTGIFKLEAAPPFIIALDEFQYARTKDNDGNDYDNFFSRGIWELFDSGKLSVNPDIKHLDDLELLVKELKYFQKNGVKVENGYVIAGQEFYKSYMEDEHSEVYAGWKPIRGNQSYVYNFEKEPYSGKPVRYISQHILSMIYDYIQDWFEHKLELYTRIFKMNDSETIEFLEKVIQHARGKKQVDCSKALIFVMGNLDEAYTFSGIVSSEMGADEFHEISKKINIYDVKDALVSRFRFEHIARLGNNHIIYPALSSASFYKIIENRLAELAKPFEQLHNIKILYHSSIIQLIYNEGVYPVQGTRPVFSTIQKIVEPLFTYIPVLLYPRNKKVHHLFIDVVNDLVILNLTSRKGLPIKDITIPIKLDLAKLKTPLNDQLQAVIAVHEAGHALLGILLTGKIPEKVISYTSYETMQGITVFESEERKVNSRDRLLKKATICLGGIIAENLIYGKDHTSNGSESDLIQATSIVIEMIKRNGLGMRKYYIQSQSSYQDDAILDYNFLVNEEARNLIEECSKKAEHFLQENIVTLKILAKELFTKSVLFKKDIQQVLAENGVSIEMYVKQNAPIDYIEKLMV